MPYNLTQVRALCTTAEFNLVAASSSRVIGKLSRTELRDKITRARNARDKYRDLTKRQRLALRERTGSKKGGRKEANVRTEQKAKIFDEALGRFQRRAEKLKASAASGRKASTAGNGAAGKGAARKPAATKSAAARAPARKPATGKGTARKGTAVKGGSGKAAATKARAPSSPKKAGGRVKRDATAARGSRAAGGARTRKANGPARTVGIARGKGDGAADAGGFMDEAARAASLRAMQRKTRAKAIGGHVRATGQRRQAKRDSRGR